eukprot:2801575-Amphidinium_carterae.1
MSLVLVHWFLLASQQNPPQAGGHGRSAPSYLVILHCLPACFPRPPYPLHLCCSPPFSNMHCIWCAPHPTDICAYTCPGIAAVTTTTAHAACAIA